MKKLILILLLLGTVLLSNFAKDNKDLNIALNFASPYSLTFGENTEKIQIKASQLSFGGGITIQENFENKMGYFTSFNLSFKNDLNIVYRSSEKPYFPKDENDTYSFFIADFLVATSFKVLNFNLFSLSINPGFHCRYILGINQQPLFLGLGLNFTAALKLSKRIDIHSSCDFYYDYYEIANYGTKCPQFVILPSLGIGFYL